jgi:hypothetical protein
VRQIITKGDQKGGALVEFALVLPLLLLLVLGIIEFSLLLYNKAMITNASREGARFGILYSLDRANSTAMDADIKDVALNYCQNYLVTFGSAEPIPSVIQGPCTKGGDLLEVQVTYEYEFLVFPEILAGFFGGQNTGNIQLSANTIMRCE